MLDGNLNKLQPNLWSTYLIDKNKTKMSVFRFTYIYTYRGKKKLKTCNNS